MNDPAITPASEDWFEDAERLLHEARIVESRRAALPTIEGYEQFSRLSQGGQGVVYRAVESSTGRAVAIKLLSDISGSSIANRHRFEREIEMGARLDHPGIVRVLDSGRTLDGRAFLVMEYIEGCSLSRLLDMPYGDAAAPESDEASHPCTWPVRQALELIVKICDAVHFAHHRGVIHRDLKPGNIQICDGEPRVLDFGLARALDAREGTIVSATTTGSFLGSLPWASPEQVQGRIDDLSVATDIYSIGVIAYQVLTGRFPYCVDGSLHSIIENITDPQKRPEAPSIYRAELHSDIDEIVLRCLEKDLRRRYASVAALADDIRRHLAGEPIEMRREQRWKGMQARLRAARRGLIATAILALLLTGLAYGAIGLQRQAARTEKLATEQLMQAKLERDRSDAVLRLLEHSFASINPANPAGSTSATHEMMQLIADQASFELAGQPEAEMQALLMVASIQHNLGDHDNAETTLHRVLQLAHSIGAGARQGEAADQALREAQALQTLGLISHARHRLEDAEDYFRQACVILSSDSALANHPVAIHAQIDLSVVLAAQGDFIGARRSLESALEAARGAFDARAPEPLAMTLYRLGELALKEIELEQAEQYLSDAGQILESFGPNSVQLADCLIAQAELFRRLRRFQEAKDYSQRAAAIYETRLGHSHWRTATAWIAHAEALSASDRNDPAADELLSRALKVLVDQLGPTHPAYAFALERRGSLHLARGQCEQATEYYERAVAVLLEATNAHPAQLATVKGRLACCTGRRDGDDQSPLALHRALEELRSSVPPADERLKELQECLDELRGHRTFDAPSGPAGVESKSSDRALP